MTNWKKLVEDNEEEIREALEKIFTDACMESIGAFKATRSAILDNDGEIRFQYDTGNSTDGAVWHGNAIYIGACEDFIPWENDSEWEWIEPCLTDEEKQKFIQFCMDQNYDSDCETFRNFRSLEEFDTKLYQKIVSESINNYLDIEKDSWIDEQMNRLELELQHQEDYI